jgi:hypothetical protein
MRDRDNAALAKRTGAWAPPAASQRRGLKLRLYLADNRDQ